MRKLICILAALLLLAALPVGVLAEESVQSMIDALPTVEEFQTMDSDQQLEVYNRTQAAYDAYMALSDEEKAKITGGEETFEALFSHFNSLVMPLEAAAVQEAPEEETSMSESLLSSALAAGLVIFVLRAFGKKKKI